MGRATDERTRAGGTEAVAVAREQAGPVEVDAGLSASAGDLAGGGPAPAQRSRWVPVVSYAATVLALVSLNFALPRLMPGDPIAALLSASSSTYVDNDETRAALADYYGLDQPVATQYVRYLRALVTGDLGHSIYYNRPVAGELRARIGWTLLLITTAMLLSMLIGLPTGVHSGWRRGRGVDRGLLGFFLSVQNLPVFFVGSVVLILFAVQLGLFPAGGATTPYMEQDMLHEALDIAHHLALPALLMALEFAAYEYLVMRSAMVGELGADYLLAARARGLRERTLKYGYAGRNALLPVVTVIGMQFSLAITSSVFVERLFSYPGIGKYMFDAVASRDYPAMQGAFLVMTVAVLTTNLLVDLVYRRLDPRTAT